MAISRNMTATEANVANYIQEIRNKRSTNHSKTAQKIPLWQRRALENIIESLRVNFWASHSCKRKPMKGIIFLRV